jgi:hypothetical protein
VEIPFYKQAALCHCTNMCQVGNCHCSSETWFTNHQRFILWNQRMGPNLNISHRLGSRLSICSLYHYVCTCDTLLYLIVEGLTCIPFNPTSYFYRNITAPFCLSLVTISLLQFVWTEFTVGIQLEKLCWLWVRNPVDNYEKLGYD